MDKTRLGFWILGAAFLWFLGPAILHSIATPAPARNPFHLPPMEWMHNPMFVVFAVTIVIASAGASGNAARARAAARDSRHEE